MNVREICGGAGLETRNSRLHFWTDEDINPGSISPLFHHWEVSIYDLNKYDYLKKLFMNEIFRGAGEYIG